MTAPHLGPGHRVAGSYTVRALLGFTGESATYHAVSDAGQEVVIKLYDPALGQRGDVMGELERARGQVAALPPGGAVPVIDAGYDVGTGAPYDVTEYLRIPSLASLVAQQPLAASVVAQILHGMAQILDPGQSQQLSHLALKPSNIFVGPAPHHQVRITDFAASVVRRASPTHEAYAHSAPWWAPEQLQPAARLGAPTDVFTAALVAFHAMTGRSYWRSCQHHPPDLSAWQAEVMGERVPVSARARELGAVINPIVDPIFARCLSVNQPDRPRSVSELAAVLAGQGTGPHPESAKTLAFPELGPTPGGDAGHAPPPPAFGGQHPPPPQDHGFGQAPPAQAAPAQAPAAPAQAAPPHGPGVTPGLPPVPPARKKEKGNTMPIVIGVVVALIVGGTGAAFLLFGTDDTATETSGDGGSGPSRTAGGGGDEDPSAAGSDAGSNEMPSGEGGNGTAAPDDEPETVEAVITCKPACDELYVDNEEIKKEGEPLQLVPGKHVVKAIKRGYVTRVEELMVPEDGRFEKELALVRIPVSPKTDKPCGQFLRPCK